MSRRPVMLISSYVVRGFVTGGGSLRYHAIRDETGAKVWEVCGVDRDGNEIPVIVGRTGFPKILRSATAIVNYHKSMLPQAHEVVIPLHDDDGDVDNSIEEEDRED